LEIEQIHSGSYLLYKHLNGNKSNENKEDNFTLIIYGNIGNSENEIKIEMFVNIIEASELLNVNILNFLLNYLNWKFFLIKIG